MDLDSGNHGEISFEAQLIQTKEFLASKLSALRDISVNSEIFLHLGWTPRIPQDSIAFDPELIQILGSLNGYIVLDTYADD